MSEMHENPLFTIQERYEIAAGSAQFWKECYEQKVKQLQEAEQRISDLMWIVYPGK